MAGSDLVLSQKVPNQSEARTVGAATTRIARGTPAFMALKDNVNPDIVYKDEEHTGADRMMTGRLQKFTNALATKVKAEWPALRLRVTEAWDEDIEHSTNSTHYEARAVDVTTSDKDDTKLGRLGRLAVEAGFDWVYYEDTDHVHASVLPDNAAAMINTALKHLKAKKGKKTADGRKRSRQPNKAHKERRQATRRLR